MLLTITQASGDKELKGIYLSKALTCMKFFLYKQKCFFIKETDIFGHIVVWTNNTSDIDHFTPQHTVFEQSAACLSVFLELLPGLKLFAILWHTGWTETVAWTWSTIIRLQYLEVFSPKMYKFLVVKYIFISTLFKKSEGDIVIASVRLSVRPSAMLSPPKPLDEIQPNLMCELLTWMGRATSNICLAPPPGALGRGQKVKYHFISITKSISKIFNQTLCVYSQMKDTKHIRRDFYSAALVMPKGWDLGWLGAKIKFCPAVCPLCYLLLNHWTKFNQIRCVSYSYKWGMQRQFFLPRPVGPWGEVKISNIILFQLQSQFQRFLYQTLCVYSQMKDTKHIRWDFYSAALVMP